MSPRACAWASTDANSPVTCHRLTGTCWPKVRVGVGVGVGGLLVGVPGPGGLVFRGRVGGGIGAAIERQLLAELEPRRVEHSPFAEGLPREDARGAIWVRPQVVVEVKYSQRTPDGRLRFPRLLRLRPDKPPEEVSDAG